MFHLHIKKKLRSCFLKRLLCLLIGFTALILNALPQWIQPDAKSGAFQVERVPFSLLHFNNRWIGQWQTPKLVKGKAESQTEEFRFEGKWHLGKQFFDLRETIRRIGKNRVEYVASLRSEQPIDTASLYLSVKLPLAFLKGRGVRIDDRRFRYSESVSKKDRYAFRGVKRIVVELPEGNLEITGEPFSLGFQDSRNYAAKNSTGPGSYALQTLVTPEQLRALLPASVLPVKVVMRETSEQEIAFQTVEMKDNSRPATYSRVKTEGKEGVSQIVSEVTYVNGVETARKTVSETVITEPVNRQVIIGTAHTLAASKSAGATLLYPIDKSRTYISAYYGDGRGHTGMDIAGPVGTEIYAAADGVVQSVNSSGSGYGIHVVVKHDGNLATLYGHCSQLLVQPGDTIQAGQVIALSGNTGYSTGPHLHFEVRIGNTRVDPAPYLGIGN